MKNTDLSGNGIVKLSSWCGNVPGHVFIHRSLVRNFHVQTRLMHPWPWNYLSKV